MGAGEFEEGEVNHNEIVLFILLAIVCAYLFVNS